MKFRDKSIVLEPADVSCFTNAADKIDVLVKMLTGTHDAGPLAVVSTELKKVAAGNYPGIDVPKKREKKPSANGNGESADTVEVKATRK